MDEESIKRERKQARVPCNIDVVISDALIFKVFDISEGGLFIYTEHCIKPGSVVDVTLGSGAEKIELKSRVKHIHEGVGMGLMFIDLNDKLKAQIKKLISDIQAAS